MTSSLARFISFIFNPILLLVFVPFFMLYKVEGDWNAAIWWTGYSMLFLLALTLFLAIAVRKGIFTNMDVSKREQRPLLFMVCSILGIIYLIGLFQLNGPVILKEIMVGIMLGILIVSFINTRLKASIHVATVSALLFSLAVVYNGYYLLLLALIPLVAWSRLKIKRHTLPETVVGGLLGILLSLLIYVLGKVLFP